MTPANRHALSAALVVGISAFGLFGCATGPSLDQPAAPAGAQRRRQLSLRRISLGVGELRRITRKKIARVLRRLL